MFSADRRAKALAGATHVLFIHALGDHARDAASIATGAGVPVACIHELAERLQGRGAQATGFGRGGTLDLGGARVTMMIAVHSASIDVEGAPPIPAGEPPAS